MEKVFAHFRKNDKLLYRYLKKYPQVRPIIKDKPENYFRRLCSIIIGQQLSGKVADVITARFEKLFGSGEITPGNLLALPQEILRGTGISNAKAQYLKNLAEFFRVNSVPARKLDGLADNDLIVFLTAVKGIGSWTAEMFLIFVLGREDVFSFGDYGLKKAIKNIYEFKRDPSKKSVEKIIRRWSPYKSYACRVLWLSME